LSGHGAVTANTKSEDVDPLDPRNARSVPEPTLGWIRRHVYTIPKYEPTIVEAISE